MIGALALLLLQSDLEQAQAMLRAGKLAEAQKAVTAALLEQPDSVEALTVQGRLAMAQNDFDLARLSFERSAKLAPRSPFTQFLLGFFYYVDNDFARARPALELARKLAPEDARAALFLALAEEGLAQPDRAEALFKETLQLEAKGKPTVEAHVAYARMLFANGRFADAQSQVTRALAIDANAREALYEQARLDFEAGRMPECIANAERALVRSGDAVTARQIHFLLSRAYARAGDTAKSRLHRERFESIPPRLIR
jgi:tetratricopeptide (TPR) repeat protein